MADFSTSVSPKYPKRWQTERTVVKPSVTPHYDQATDRQHWAKQPSPAMPRDGIEAGRTSKAEWWSKSGDQKFQYGRTVDAMYEQEQFTVQTSVASSPLRYKTMDGGPGLKRYPASMLSHQNKNTTLGPGQYSHKPTADISEYEPPRKIVGFNSQTNRTDTPVGFRNTTQRMLYDFKGRNLTSYVDSNFDIDLESKKWREEVRPAVGMTIQKREGVVPNQMHIRVIPSMTGKGGALGGSKKKGDDEDEFEFGDPFEWMLEGPNGEQRVKDALRKIEGPGMSLRQLIRQRRRDVPGASSLHSPKFSIPELQDDFDKSLNTGGPKPKKKVAPSTASSHVVFDKALVRINVKFLTGITTTVRMHMNDTIADLKEKVRQKRGYAPGEQVLLFEAHRLKDGETIEASKLKDYSTVRCRLQSNPVEVGLDQPGWSSEESLWLRSENESAC
jgi:hypothetical protein